MKYQLLLKKMPIVILFSIFSFTSCVDDVFDDLYEDIDMPMPRKKGAKDIFPTDWPATWVQGECATWALLYLDNSNHINSGKEKNRIINALCGKEPSYSVSPETMISYNQSVAAGGFGKSAIISASVKLGLNLEEVSFDDLGINRHNSNKNLGGVIMSTGYHVIVPLKYKKKSDEFEYRDIYTGPIDTSSESADNISYSLGHKKKEKQ